jgi:hypothetical protein
MIDFEMIQAKWAIESEREKQACAKISRAIFDALQRLGILSVSIGFDGSSDEGGIESIETSGPPLAGEVTYEVLSPDGTLSSELSTLEDAIETVCYRLLSAEHCGWPNNDGAFGTFTFDVAARKVELEFNARYTEHHTTCHTYTDAEVI